MKQKSPPIDVRKVLRAAAEAALEEPAPAVKPKKRRLSTGRAMLLGAGAVTAGRILTRRGDVLLHWLQGRLADLGEQPDLEERADVDAEALKNQPDAEVEDQLEDALPDEGEEQQSNGGQPENRPRPRARRGRS